MLTNKRIYDTIVSSKGTEKEIKEMTSYAVNKIWYNEIKERVNTVDPYHFTECGIEMVEFDVNEEEFIKVSTELGWM